MSGMGGQHEGCLVLFVEGGAGGFVTGLEEDFTDVAAAESGGKVEI